VQTLEYLIYAMVCYMIGWFMTGYFVVRIYTRKDLRFEGSGNIGALNAGRAAGRRGFMLTMIGDALKGIMAVNIGIYFDFPKWALLLGLTLVVLGHIYPLPLKFQGGKGVSTFLGGVLIYSPESIPLLIGGFVLSYLLISYLLIRDFTLAGLIAFVFWPLSAVYDRMNNGGVILLLQIALISIILWAHRTNITDYIKKTRMKRGIKDGDYI